MVKYATVTLQFAIGTKDALVFEEHLTIGNSIWPASP